MAIVKQKKKCSDRKPDNHCNSWRVIKQKHNDTNRYVSAINNIFMEGVCPNGNCAPQKSERSYLFINFYFVRVTRMVSLGTLVKYIQWKKNWRNIVAQLENMCAYACARQSLEAKTWWPSCSFTLRKIIRPDLIDAQWFT